MKTYISWSFGTVSIRECGTDRVLWQDSHVYSICAIDAALNHAESIAKSRGYSVIWN